MKLLDRVLSKKSKEFFDGIEAHPYQYRDDKVEKGTDNFKDENSMSRSLAEHAEVLGRALQAEMDRTGKPLSEKMFNSMERKFKLYKSNDEKYKNLDMSNVYSFPSNIASVRNYLVETWKFGHELGRALGVREEGIEELQANFDKHYAQKAEKKANETKSKSDFVQTTTHSDVKSY
ncbi:MAG: hypothetical protein J6T72_05560 [Alphaproteobacteria bacterium]|nr:hypothetical protein [Alphaproteobacteria bacterium]